MSPDAPSARAAADVAPDGSLDWERPVAAAAALQAHLTDVLSLDLPALQDFVVALGEKPFRAQQLFDALHRRLVTSFDAITELSLPLRKRLGEVAAVRAPRITDVRASSDGTRKYQLETHDGHVIESVFIPDASGPGKNALCISSQVGCAMGCRFCATASLKLTRHLTPGEIAGQLYAVVRDLEENVPWAPPRTDLAPESDPDDDLIVDAGDDDALAQRPVGGRPPRRIQNIVYMGMGEPLHNIDGVIASVALLRHQRGQGYSARRITVSTSGLVPAIERLGQETDVHLAVSLNGSNDEQRASVMPVNRRYPLSQLLAACRNFPLKGRERITFEYVLLAGVNDADDDARRVVKLLSGMKCKVNLIPFNPHPLSPYQRPDDERVRAFREIVAAKGVSVFVRSTRGLDIDAACGMLGAKKLEAARGLPVLA